MKRSNGTIKITIQLPEQDARAIATLLEECAGNDPTTHGRLTLETLAAMLLQDVALVLHRPGSWEGAGLLDVLQRHRYLQ